MNPSLEARTRTQKQPKMSTGKRGKAEAEEEEGEPESTEETVPYQPNKRINRSHTPKAFRRRERRTPKRHSDN